MKGTFAVVTLGCKTNQFESAALAEQLERAGYRQVDFSAGADLVVVNTCTVTAATDGQSRNLIRRARRLNPACRVVATGCYAQVNPAALANLPGVDLVLGNAEKPRLCALLDETGPTDGGATVRVGDIRRTSATVMDLCSFGGRSRAFVQIQNGCDAFCSYCIIPYARGASRSAPPAQVLAQVKRLVEAGYPEVVLTGIHIGAYGLDLQPATSLAALAQRLVRETDIARLRLGSVEPLEVTDELVATVAACARICPHFHIPLQAGDDGVLQAMNRHYSTDYFRSLVDKIVTRLPAAAIGIDVIAGFPGESAQAFENCERLIEALPVSHLHVFPYSRRPGTAAAAMPGHLPGPVVRERAARLRALGERKQAQFARRFVGRTLQVVVEGAGQDGLHRGLSENYLEVRFSAPRRLEGRLTCVRVDGWTPHGLTGTLLGEEAG